MPTAKHNNGAYMRGLDRFHVESWIEILQGPSGRNRKDTIAHTYEYESGDAQHDPGRTLFAGKPAQDQSDNQDDREQRHRHA